MPLSENPVYRREGLRNWWRSRPIAERVVTLVLYWVFLLGMYYLVVRPLLSEFGNPGFEPEMVFGIFRTTGVLGACLAAWLTAASITTEREKQTWEQLLLTRLTPKDILAGKLLGGLAPLGFFAAATAPAALIVIRLSLTELPPGERWYFAMFSVGPVCSEYTRWGAAAVGPLWWYFASFLWVFSGGCLGLLCSLIFRRSTTSQVISLASMLFICWLSYGLLAFSEVEAQLTFPLPWLPVFAWPVGGSLLCLWLAARCFR
jgi:ABC-type transport system involved in multi-copper enzyme maturation permease subunit